MTKRFVNPSLFYIIAIIPKIWENIALEVQLNSIESALGLAHMSSFLSQFIEGFPTKPSTWQLITAYLVRLECLAVGSFHDDEISWEPFL